MKTWETWMSHIATLVVALSGVAYLWMKYFVQNDDPFAVINHPWQPSMLGLHILAAPVLVFVVGLITRSHIQKKLRSGVRSNRISGLVSMAALPVMIVSGYMLQVAASPFLGRTALVLHLASSSIFVVTYAAHQIIGLRLKRPAAESRAAFAGRPTA